MTNLGRGTELRPCEPSDDAFLHDVFCTTWESEVAALPNKNLAQHILRIQHIAQERRFATRYPGHDRLVVLDGGRRAGRLYLFETESSLQVVDLTLLPQFRSSGIGTRILRHLMSEAARDGSTISLGVPRTNKRATELYAALGFQLVSVDDLENGFQWTPATVTGTPVVRSAVGAMSRPGSHR
jgi:ribosomal protein S18 acetylase RimI-like enzyme